MTDAAAKAKQARAELEFLEPESVAIIDALRTGFGARLTYLRVGDIEVGKRETWDRIEALPPSSIYYRPGEARQEFEEIKREINSRDAALDRTSGRRLQRLDQGAQVPRNAEMEI